MKEKYREREREKIERRERGTRVEESLEIWVLRCISASERQQKALLVQVHPRYHDKYLY